MPISVVAKRMPSCFGLIFTGLLVNKNILTCKKKGSPSSCFVSIVAPLYPMMTFSVSSAASGFVELFTRLLLFTQETVKTKETTAFPLSATIGMRQR
jgi:hypothetical protein